LSPATIGLGLTHFGPALAEELLKIPPSPQYLPVVLNNATSITSRPKVIHLSAQNVTNWDFNPAHYYGKTQAPGVLGVNQSVVDGMIDRGITELFGLPLSSLNEAWGRSIPDYSQCTVVRFGWLYRAK
jgi:hypothetical protein